MCRFGPCQYFLCSYVLMICKAFATKMTFSSLLSHMLSSRSVFRVCEKLHVTALMVEMQEIVSSEWNMGTDSFNFLQLNNMHYNISRIAAECDNIFVQPSFLQRQFESKGHHMADNCNSIWRFYLFCLWLAYCEPKKCYSLNFVYMVLDTTKGLVISSKMPRLG